MVRGHRLTGKQRSTISALASVVRCAPFVRPAASNGVFVEGFAATQGNPSQTLRKHLRQGCDEMCQHDGMVTPPTWYRETPERQVVFAIAAPSQAQLLPEFPCLSLHGAK
jgi:hypothetical protein